MSFRDPCLPPRHVNPSSVPNAANRPQIVGPSRGEAGPMTLVEDAERRELSRISGLSPHSHDVTDVLQVLNQLKGTLAENKLVTEEIVKPGLFNHFRVMGGVQPPQEHYNLSHGGSLTSKDRKDVKVYCRVLFLRMGEIQTIKERYNAEVYIQARWREPLLDDLTEDQIECVDLNELWNPKLFTENSLGAPKSKVWRETWKEPQSGEMYMLEKRLAGGVWGETLELWDFPFDCQDLSVTIGSGRRDNELHMIEDTFDCPSGIKKKDFVDEQEWYLHTHVEISHRVINHWYSQPPYSQPFITFTTRASRRLGFYFWHVYLMLVLITSMTFTSFAIRGNPPDYRPWPPESGYERRLRLTFLLMLTTVSFKFFVGETLPKIPYLTRLDKYLITCFIFHGIISVWHGFVYWFEWCNEQFRAEEYMPHGNRPPEKLAPGRSVNSNCPYVVTEIQERYFILGYIVLFLLYNVYYFLEIYMNVMTRRRAMEDKDRKYVRRAQRLIEEGRMTSMDDIYVAPKIAWQSSSGGSGPKQPGGDESAQKATAPTGTMSENL